jgi:hypothetical protein
VWKEYRCVERVSLCGKSIVVWKECRGVERVSLCGLDLDRPEGVKAVVTVEKTCVSVLEDSPQLAARLQALRVWCTAKTNV